MVRNPIIIAPTGGLAVGLSLNIAEVRSPGWMDTVNAVALPTAVCLYAFSIGLTLRLGRIGRYARELGIILGTKFLVGPALGVSVVFVLGQWGAYEGLLWRVTVIEGAMPVGVFATVIANLYDLDRDLANSAWIVTTLATAAVIPLLCVVTGAW
jgi:predicted permease